MAIATPRFSVRLYLVCLAALTVPLVLGVVLVSLLFLHFNKEVPP